MKNKLIESNYKWFHIPFTDDGWFNATIVAGNFGKRPVDWLVLDTTQEYISTLLDIKNNEQNQIGPNVRNSHISNNEQNQQVIINDNSSLLKTKRGNSGGTWMHPSLAVPFARWLDTRFAIWCDMEIRNILLKKHPTIDWNYARHAAASSNKVMNNIIKLTRELQGKETESHNYSNEVRLVNYILKGKFESLDRNSLSKEELDRLFFLEQNNSALMGAGVEYAKRKAILKTMLLNKYPVLT